MVFPLEKMAPPVAWNNFQFFSLGCGLDSSRWMHGPLESFFNILTSLLLQLYAATPRGKWVNMKGLNTIQIGLKTQWSCRPPKIDPLCCIHADANDLRDIMVQVFGTHPWVGRDHEIPATAARWGYGSESSCKSAAETRVRQWFVKARGTKIAFVGDRCKLHLCDQVNF